MTCEQKVPYASEMLADNAAWLHQAAYPECGGIEAYLCTGCGSWHIGHGSPQVAAACHLIPRPRLHAPHHRPSRWAVS